MVHRGPPLSLVAVSGSGSLCFWVLETCCVVEGLAVEVLDTRQCEDFQVRSRLATVVSPVSLFVKTMSHSQTSPNTYIE